MFCNILAMVLSLMAGVIPDATQKSKEYREKAIEMARETGAKNSLGLACLGLGQLYSAEGDKDKARQYILQAVALFEQCELTTLLAQAKEALENLK